MKPRVGVQVPHIGKSWHFSRWWTRAGLLVRESVARADEHACQLSPAEAQYVDHR